MATETLQRPDPAVEAVARTRLQAARQSLHLALRAIDPQGGGDLCEEHSHARRYLHAALAEIDAALIAVGAEL